MNYSGHNRIALAPGTDARLSFWRPLKAGQKIRPRFAWFRPVLFGLLLWTSVGLFQAVPEMLKGFSWPILVGKVIDAWAWALLTPPLLLIERNLASREQNAPRLALLYLLLSVPVSLVHTYLSAVLLYPIREVWWSPLRDHDFAVYFFLGSWVTYCAIVGIFHAFKFYNRFLTGQLQLERIERTLSEARLNALRLQLEPHFLFNALNAISSEIGSNPKLAREMISNLGTLLRQSLDCKGKAEITLAEELGLLEHYVSIHRVRFGDRIYIRIDVDPDSLSAMVPSMLLQPLVENSIRHGIEGRISGGTIVLTAARRGSQLRIDVADDGVGLPRDWEADKPGGHGLRVTRERLSTLYPGSEDRALTIRRRVSGGTCVTVLIPLRGEEMEEHEIVA